MTGTESRPGPWGGRRPREDNAHSPHHTTRTGDAHGWLRVSPRQHCPICDGAGWCSVAADGGAAICMRSSDGAVREVACGGAGVGYLHALLDELPPRAREPRSRPIATGPDWSALVAERAAATTDAALAAHARALGVSLRSLRRLDAFVARRWPTALCVPMRRASGRCVGVRVRAASGAKWCVRGSRNALFVARDGASDGPLLLPEGPTDAAALLDCDYAAIGRPNASACAADVALVAAGRDAIVVADRDGPGRDGAERIAHALLGVAARVRIAEPPPPHKDVRALVVAGGGRDAIAAMIASARELRVSVRLVGALAPEVRP